MMTFGRTRTLSGEYLKRYQKPENEAKNEYARWLVRRYAPHDIRRMGDRRHLYVSDIRKYAETWEDHTEKDMRGSILKRGFRFPARRQKIRYLA